MFGNVQNRGLLNFALYEMRPPIILTMVINMIESIMTVLNSQCVFIPSYHWVLDVSSRVSLLSSMESIIIHVPGPQHSDLHTMENLRIM